MKRSAIGFCLCISIVGWAGVGHAKGKAAAPAAEPAADSNAAAGDQSAAPADSTAAPADTVSPEGEVTPEGGG